MELLKLSPCSEYWLELFSFTTCNHIPQYIYCSHYPEIRMYIFWSSTLQFSPCTYILLHVQMRPLSTNSALYLWLKPHCYYYVRRIKISFKVTAVLPWRFTPRLFLRITKCNMRQRCWARGGEELLLLRNLEAYAKSRTIVMLKTLASLALSIKK